MKASQKLLLASLAALSLLIAGNSYVHPVSAQGVETPACPQIAWSCAEVTDLDEGKNGVAHRQRLVQSGLPGKNPDGTPTQFIIACGMNTDRGFLASTGNKAVDKEYCLSTGAFDSLDYLKTNYKYQLNFQGFSNPFTAPDGSIDKIAIPANEGDPVHHMCVIGWKLPVTTTGSSSTSTGTNEESGKTSGLEYTTFTFPVGEAQCMSVYADPFGRVYNASLKPIPGIDVSIYDFDSRTLMSIFGLANPVRTTTSGIFNFNLPPGRTFLETSTSNLSEVHPNYALAYTKPYTNGDLIVETLGNAEQRDIAVSGGGTPQLELTGYTYIRTGSHLLVQGTATWPLTLVSLLQGTSELMSQQSDKFGNFTFKIDPLKLDPTKQLTIKLTEVDLTTNPRIPASSPATDSVTVDPIPSYLEGFAYNSQGVKVPFAKVRIRLQLSDALYYETYADKDAYYSVAPRNIPIFPFYLEILPSNQVPLATGTTLPGGTGGSQNGSLPGTTGAPTTGTTGTSPTTSSKSVSKITIPTYAQQNKEYHDTEVVDIMSGTKNGTKVDPVAVGDSSTAVFGDDEANSRLSQNPGQSKDMELEQSRTQRFLKALIFVVLLVFIGTISVILIRKRDGAGSDSDNVYTKDPLKE